MSYTPGPWVWGDVKSGSAGERHPNAIPYLARTGTAEDLTLYGEGDALGSLPILSVDVGKVGAFPKPADAHLIIAAPDLLEACKLALLEIEHLTNHRGIKYNTIKAAIAKAEGITE